MNSRSSYIEETPDAFMVKVPKPSTRYLDEFLRLECATDLLLSGAFSTGAADLTTAMGAFAAVRRYLGRVPDFAFDNPTVRLVSVGESQLAVDTAALFAFRTKWLCNFIVPSVKKVPCGTPVPNIARLSAHTMRVTDGMWVFDGPTIIVIPDGSVDPGVVAKHLFAFNPSTEERHVRAFVHIGEPWLDTVMDESPLFEVEDGAIWQPWPNVEVWV